MSKVMMWAVLALVAGVEGAAAQQAAAPVNPGATSLARQFATVSGYVMRAADQIPEDKYGWKPTPEVMSFAALIDHVTDSFYTYCARTRGEAAPTLGATDAATMKKAELVAKLKDGIAYCTAAYASVTDATLLEMAQVGQSRFVRLSPAVTNISHTNEHYGNLVTYLRINGMVPPSSQGN